MAVHSEGMCVCVCVVCVCVCVCVCADQPRESTRSPVFDDTLCTLHTVRQRWVLCSHTHTHTHRACQPPLCIAHNPQPANTVTRGMPKGMGASICPKGVIPRDLLACMQIAVCATQHASIRCKLACMHEAVCVSVAVCVIVCVHVCRRYATTRPSVPV